RWSFRRTAARRGPPLRSDRFSAWLPSAAFIPSLQGRGKGWVSSDAARCCGAASWSLLGARTRAPTPIPSLLAGRGSSVLQLRQHALELHRVRHVALDLELPHHEGRHSVHLTGGHLLPVVPADADGGVRGPIVLAHLQRRAVEHDRALVAAEVDLHPLAGDPRLALLHPRDEFLLGHWLLSPLSVAVAGLRRLHNILSVAKRWGGGPLSAVEWWRGHTGARVRPRPTWRRPSRRMRECEGCATPSHVYSRPALHRVRRYDCESGHRDFRVARMAPPPFALQRMVPLPTSFARREDETSCSPDRPSLSARAWDTKPTSSSSSTARGNRARTATASPSSTRSTLSRSPSSRSRPKPTSTKPSPPPGAPIRNGARPTSRSAPRSSTRRPSCFANAPTRSAGP